VTQSKEDSIIEQSASLTEVTLSADYQFSPISLEAHLVVNLSNMSQSPKIVKSQITSDLIGESELRLQISTDP